MRWGVIRRFFMQLIRKKPLKITDYSYALTIPKKGYKSWLNAVAFDVGWLTVEELKELIDNGVLKDDRKYLLVIPIFPEDEGV